MWCASRRPLYSELINPPEILSDGVPVLVPVRASPVPSVVRGSFVVKFFLTAEPVPRGGQLPLGSPGA